MDGEGSGLRGGPDYTGYGTRNIAHGYAGPVARLWYSVA